MKKAEKQTLGAEINKHLSVVFAISTFALIHARRRLMDALLLLLIINNVLI